MKNSILNEVKGATPSELNEQLIEESMKAQLVIVKPIGNTGVVSYMHHKHVISRRTESSDYV